MNTEKSTAIETAEAKPDCAPRTCSAAALRKELEMITAKIIQARIDMMPPAEREACEEIAEHIRAVAKSAGRDVAINAVFLVAFELKETEEHNDPHEPSGTENSKQSGA